MQCAGAGGALVGKGAHLLVIDDPIKNAEEGTSALQLENLWDWWQSTASTRLEPNGIAIIIQQRWHEDDLSGKLIKSAKSGEGDPITLIDLPAIGQEGDEGWSGVSEEREMTSGKAYREMLRQTKLGGEYQRLGRELLPGNTKEEAHRLAAEQLAPKLEAALSAKKAGKDKKGGFKPVPGLASRPRWSIQQDVE